MDRILLLGINHKVAPAVIREKLAFSQEGVVAATQELKPLLPGNAEVVLLSTCNRTELIIHSDDPVEAENTGREFLYQKGRLAEDALEVALYIYKGREAVRHLFRVAGGLDSLVIGESEIQGQVRKAAELAQISGTSGVTMNALFRSAIQYGKKVRSETEIGKINLSVATLVVELAEKRLGELNKHTALMIGAGKISTLTAREMVQYGLHCVLIANRTFERAQKLANNLGVQYASAVHFDKLDENLADADIVICSTGAPHTVLHIQSVIEAMKKRPERSMLVFDLAIPHDVDSSIKNLPNVELIKIDDLSSLVQECYPLTEKTWRDAEYILEQAGSDYENWYEARRAAPFIRALREKADSIVRTEVERTFRRLGSLSEEQKAVIERLGQSIVNKILHEPITNVKNQRDLILRNESLEMLHTLFGLEKHNKSSKPENKE